MIALLIALSSVQAALYQRTSLFAGISASAFFLTGSAMVDVYLKEKNQRLALVKFLKNCHDAEFIKEYLHYLTPSDTHHLMRKAVRNKNNTLVLTLMENGFRDDRVFHDVIVYSKLKNPELALALLEKGFKEEGYEEWALGFVKDDKLRNALIQKKQERIEAILKSNDPEFIYSALKKYNTWHYEEDFRKRVLSEGTNILQQTIFSIVLDQELRFDKNFDKIALEMLNGGFLPYAKTETNPKKINQALDQLIATIQTTKPDTNAWKQVIEKLKSLKTQN